VEDIYYQTDKNGVVIGYDMVSGEVVHRSDSMLVKRVPYNLETAKKILHLVREGHTIAAIGRMSEFPSSAIIFNWLGKHPDFKEAMEQARIDRAEVYHDKALEVAENVTDKEDVPAARLKIDTYKWAAEKGDKSRYGTSKIDIDVNQRDIVVIDTGIDRSKTYDEPIDGQFVEVSQEEGGESSATEGASEASRLLEGDQVDAGEAQGEDDTISGGAVQSGSEGDHTESDQVGEE